MVKILLVEDDPRTVSFIRRGLEAEGFAVDVAENGRDGLAHARAIDYPLIVLDRMLPRIDGQIGGELERGRDVGPTGRGRGGTGSFVLEVRDPKDVAAAMLEKFLRDLNVAREPPGALASLTLQRAAGADQAAPARSEI